MRQASRVLLAVLGAVMMTATAVADIVGASADAYVRSDQPAENYGSATTLRINNRSETTSFRMKAYVRFDLSTLSIDPDERIEATLKLNFIESGGGSNPLSSYMFSVYGLNDGYAGVDKSVSPNGSVDDDVDIHDEAWPEAVIDWSSAPANVLNSADGLTGDAQWLGAFSVAEKGIGLVDFTSPELNAFIGASSDDLVTFIIVRNTSAAYPSDYVHAIAPRESEFGPMLDVHHQVPEPASSALWVAGAAVMLLRPRRRPGKTPGGCDVPTTPSRSDWQSTTINDS